MSRFQQVTQRSIQRFCGLRNIRICVCSTALVITAITAITAIPATAQTAFLPSMGFGDVTMPVTSIKASRTATTLLQKYDFSCGSAALATLLTHHYGTPMTEAVVFESMYRTGDQAKIRREGFSLLDMKKYLATLGFEADGFEQPLEKLVEARVPAIVLINEHGYQHFVVIKGMQGDRILIGDPANGTRAVARKMFESSWKNGLLFVVHNHMDIARFNLATDWHSAPQAPLYSGVNRDGLGLLTMPRNPGDF